MTAMTVNPLIGSWTYRSFFNVTEDPEPFDEILFGEGTLVFTEAPMQLIAGTIGGTGWSLELTGSMTYGNPMTAQFQGKGVVNGTPWQYSYVGYLVNAWPNGVGQVPAIVGSIVRDIYHGSGPAGEVASFIAVRQG